MKKGIIQYREEIRKLQKRIDKCVDATVVLFEEAYNLHKDRHINDTHYKRIIDRLNATTEIRKTLQSLLAAEKNEMILTQEPMGEPKG